MKRQKRKCAGTVTNSSPRFFISASVDAAHAPCSMSEQQQHTRSFAATQQRSFASLLCRVSSKRALACASCAAPAHITLRTPHRTARRV
eukprot:3715026-Rhodomonas_salina.1